MKGIILAGGSGTRLHPLTISVSKQLLPVYNKPMIYYPLTTLLLAGVNEILIISTERDSDAFRRLLGDGTAWGAAISYAIQDKPRGLADALIIGESFISKQPVALILGDNLFYGEGLGRSLSSYSNLTGAQIFAHSVRDPRPYGVVEFDKNGVAVSLEEKPVKPKSKFAVPGLYFYDSRASEFAKQLKPSLRGELEITDLNQKYLELGELKVLELGRSVVWMDMGTIGDLADAGEFVRVVESRLGESVGEPSAVIAQQYFDDPTLEV
jgi:glucose-1-phosphate thymidylyltransferase